MQEWPPQAEEDDDMIIDLIREENVRLKEELTSLRQAIIQADPSVMMDGRFEAMITSPITIIDIARGLIEKVHNPRS